MKDENRERLEAFLDEEVSGPLGDQIMSLAEDIVQDEREDAGKRGFNLGWDSALDTDENRADRPQVT